MSTCRLGHCWKKARNNWTPWRQKEVSSRGVVRCQKLSCWLYYFAIFLCHSATILTTSRLQYRHLSSLPSPAYWSGVLELTTQKTITWIVSVYLSINEFDRIPLLIRKTKISHNSVLLLLLLLLLLTRRLAWRLVNKLQGHVTHKKDDTFGTSLVC